MFIESPELESSVEQEPDELERIQDAVVAKFQERGINIDRDRLRNLITEMRYGDLNPENATETKETLEYRPERVFVQVERNGVVTVDRVEYSRLNERQKLHHILHEAAHRIDWLIAGTNNIDWQEISNIIPEMDPNDMSPYLVHLVEKYKGDPPLKLAKMIRQEAMPDLIAQYVESDGTFKSFVEQAGLETADLLDGFEDMDDVAKETFFTEYPDLQFRFHIFVNLREVLRNENLVNNTTSAWTEDYEEPFHDEIEMVSWMAEKPPEIPKEQVKKKPPPKPQTGYDPFWLFRRNS